MKTYKLKLKGENFEETIVDVNLNQYIGWKVKMIQKEKQLSTDDICNKGGISNGALISRIIRGKHNIQINNIYKVCKGLSCDSKDLLPF